MIDSCESAKQAPPTVHSNSMERAQAPTTSTELPRLCQNIAALGALQIASYLLPLVTLPYLTRVLGPESFGKFIFIQVIMQYLVMLTDYGFSWSATRNIAAVRENMQKVSIIFSATWIAQWLLVVFVALMLLASTIIHPNLREDAYLYYSGFTFVLGNVLFPLWLFNGLERMREVAIVQIIARILMLPLIFVVVAGPRDIIWAILISGLGTVLAGCGALYWIFHKSLVNWCFPSWNNVIEVFHEGWGLFLSRVSISIYTTLPPFILGILAGTTAVAYFSLADKLRNAASSLLGPISQAIFPRMSHLYVKDRRGASRLLKHSLIATLTISFGASVALWLLADFLISIIAGEQYSPSASVLRWLAFLPLLVGLSNVFGVQVMLPNRMTNAFNRILGAAGALSILLMYPLISWRQAEGAAITLLITEIFVTAVMALYLIRSGVFYPKGSNETI